MTLFYQISREKFEPESGFKPRTSRFLLSYPGSHASSRSNLPLETDATFTRRCGHDTICHLLTTSELLRHFKHEYDIQIKLLSENKVIICALGNLHYQISRETFKPEPGSKLFT